VSDNLIICHMSDEPLPISVEDFIDHGRQHWGEALLRLSRHDAPHPSRAALTIGLPGEPSYLIDYLDDGAIHCDGSDYQWPPVVAWVASLLPAGTPRVVAFDTYTTMHVDVFPGMSEEQFVAGVVDHTAPDWSDDDPRWQWE
jgi:hypothetical protein